MIKCYYLKPITFLKAIAELAEPEEEDDIKLITFNTNQMNLYINATYLKIMKFGTIA